MLSVGEWQKPARLPASASAQDIKVTAATGCPVLSLWSGRSSYQEVSAIGVGGHSVDLDFDEGLWSAESLAALSEWGRCSELQEIAGAWERSEHRADRQQPSWGTYLGIGRAAYVPWLYFSGPFKNHGYLDFLDFFPSPPMELKYRLFFVLFRFFFFFFEMVTQSEFVTVKIKNWTCS